MKYKVPASWMLPSVVGSYIITVHVNAACTRRRPTEYDLFYRITLDGNHISDHGDREGAIYAARCLCWGHRP